MSIIAAVNLFKFVNEKITAQIIFVTLIILPVLELQRFMLFVLEISDFKA
ncbi:MAG: hypothetical protein LBP59_01300 [Planctomycetaceae bacterium]|nr:hypothetical protein [Planctomycetaceae bacterium]